MYLGHSCPRTHQTACHHRAIRERHNFRLGGVSWPGDGLLEFINNKLFPTLKALSADASPRHRVIHDVFEDAYQYMKNGTLLRQVINRLNESLDFNRSEDRHVFGDLYEQILKDLQSAGNAGEYYTPRAVTQFMVDMVNPQLGEKVLDPACGTGGFLTCAIKHLQKQVKTPDDVELLQRSVLGIEKKPLPHLLCVTNMLFFTKGEPTKEIWFYEHPYPPGAKSYNKTKPIRIEEFDVEKKWWKKRKETEQAWKVPFEQVHANGYNLDIKNPHDTSVAHTDPDELLADYQLLMTDLQQTRDRLKDELFEALQGKEVSREGAKPRR